MQYIIILLVMGVLFVLTQTFVKKNKDRLLKRNPYLQAVIFACGMYGLIILAGVLSIPPNILAVFVGVTSFVSITYLAFLFIEYIKKSRGGF